MSDSAQNSGAMRASDADREATVVILNRALTDGRISTQEHNQRMSAAYAAVTMSDLQQLTADLPLAAPPAPPGPPASSHETPNNLRPRSSSGLRAMWLSWAGVSVMMIAIWFVAGITGDGGFSWQGFWPLWVIVPWGAVMLMTTIMRAGQD